MICFGPVSNLWKGAQLPTVSDAVLGEGNLMLRKTYCFPSRLLLALLKLSRCRGHRHCVPSCALPPLSGASPGLPGGQSLDISFQKGLRRKKSSKKSLLLCPKHSWFLPRKCAPTKTGKKLPSKVLLSGRDLSLSDQQRKQMCSVVPRDKPWLPSLSSYRHLS